MMIAQLIKHSVLNVYLMRRAVTYR